MCTTASTRYFWSVSFRNAVSSRSPFTKAAPSGTASRWPL